MVPRSVQELYQLKAVLRPIGMGCDTAVSRAVRQASETVDLLMWAETHQIELKRYQITTINSVENNVRTNRQGGWTASSPAFPGSVFMGATILEALYKIHQAWINTLIERRVSCPRANLQQGL